MAISQRGYGTQISSEQQENTSSREDKSDQALLHFSSGGRERRGREGRETEQQFVGRWSRERDRRGEEEYNSLNMSLLLDRNELEARCCKRNSMTPSRACRKCGNPNKRLTILIKTTWAACVSPIG